MARRSRFLNALVGMAVTVVFAVLPFSSVLGGAVAGYLEDGDLTQGATVGALAGLLAIVPLVLIFGTIGSALLFWPLGSVHPGMRLLGGAMLLLGLAFAVVYLIGLGALGGIVGAYLAEEFDRD